MTSVEENLSLQKSAFEESLASSPPDDFTRLLSNEPFMQTIVAALDQRTISDIRSMSDSLHKHPDIFLSLDEIILSLGCLEILKSYHAEMKILRETIEAYSCIKEFSPRLCILLRNAMIFVMNGLAAKKAESNQNIVLEDKDVKRLRTVYATIILNLTANPKSWLGTSEIILVEWKQEMEKRNIDKETFNAFRSYLRNKF